MSRIRVETEWDKNIEALADSLCECKVSKKTGVCTKAMCVTCEKYKQQNNVWNSMADMDRLRVNTGVHQRYNAWRVKMAEFYAYKESIRRDTIGSIMLVVLITAILLGLMVCCSASAPVKSRKSFENNIENCLRLVRDQASDVNKDGIINCQDYALLFYTAWNNSGYDKKTVALALNYNTETDMNHLFCAVRLTIYDKWEYVEPQAWLLGDYAYSYDMKEYWGQMYNPACNYINTVYLYDLYYTKKIRR